GNFSPAREGFFRILHDIAGTTSEGNDLDNNPSYRNTQIVLHFAVKLRGNNRGDFFQATLPGGSPLLSMLYPDSRFQAGGNTYFSPWSEVAFFLQPTGDLTIPDDQVLKAGGASPALPLNTLYMRQKLLVPNSDLFAPQPPPSPVAGTTPQFLGTVPAAQAVN